MVLAIEESQRYMASETKSSHGEVVSVQLFHTKQQQTLCRAYSANIYFMGEENEKKTI